MRQPDKESICVHMQKGLAAKTIGRHCKPEMAILRVLHLGSIWDLSLAQIAAANHESQPGLSALLASMPVDTIERMIAVDILAGLAA